MGKETEIIDYDNAVDEKYRIYASISFAVLLVGIGVPLWWRTTAVPRVPLPYARIEQLPNLEIRIGTRIFVAALSEDRAQSLSRDVREAFADGIYHVDVVSRVISSNLLASAFSHHDLEKIASNFDLGVGQLLLLEASNLNDAILVGSKRTIYFSPETDSFKLIRVLSEGILHTQSLELTKSALEEPTLYGLDEENRRRFPASPSYDVLISVVNPDPEKLKVEWDLAAVADDYIDPFLQELSIVSNFSVKSQWLYLVPLDVKAKRVPDSGPLGRHFALPEDILPQLVTPLEKKLASQVSLCPTINFVVYVVPCDEGPLHIYTRSGHRSKTSANVEAFLSPRWGGVALINPPAETCLSMKSSEEPVTVVPEETAIIGIFLGQLRLLLGIPEPKFIDGVTAVPLVGLKSRDWELDALLRIRTVEQLTTAKLTLHSLAQLLKKISNIVITEVVGHRIKTALSLVERSAELLARGDLTQGFLLSKEAFVTAEEAFSDPTVLSLLYFPEEQKYAVYVPLFLPAMLPVLLSLINIHRYYFSDDGLDKKRKEKRAEAKEKST